VNWTVFLIEAVLLCAVFHLVIYRLIRTRNRMIIYGYPPAIVQRWIELGKAPAKTELSRKERLKRKWPAALVIGLILGTLIYFINGCRSFLSGLFVSYGLWLIADWYDALVIDIAWFCHSGTCILEGTEDMTESYHDYAYHIRSTLVGMVIGLPVCILIGFAVQLLSWVLS